jgi:hypothetical protein
MGRYGVSADGSTSPPRSSKRTDHPSSHRFEPRRLDTGSGQCGTGVSGLWWVSEILRGMSLDGLVAQVGRVLGDARSLYGAAPQGGGWSEPSLGLIDTSFLAKVRVVPGKYDPELR